MLPDPLTVTYNSVAKTLPRSAAPRAAVRKLIGSSSFATSEHGFELFTSQARMTDGCRRAEVLLSRTTPDPDSNPFTDSYQFLPNRFGFVYEVNRLGAFSTTDIPLLRSALTSLITSAFELKVIGGEY